MKKVKNGVKYRYFIFATIALLHYCITAKAQYQFDDSHFEDWSGAQFAGAEQPMYWHFSNVTQFGFDFNFAHKEQGRSGYCLYVEDQAMKVMGINGGISPGYISSGHPWAYVPSLTNIDGSTAGTYGGVARSARPDTVSVWIKRTGSNWAKENYNILFYMWNNTAHGSSYMGKTSCTSIPQSFANVPGGGLDDEESDIRLALDANSCNTVVPGHEIGEAYFYEKAEYTNWHQVKIPVYYMNDDVPTKWNIIFSAGNYPAGKSSSGFYAGNGLYVDDLELIYSDKIDKIYIGGREWAGFDSNSSAVQTYSLGQNATTIPAIIGRRGVGREVNCNGESYDFAGRVLGSDEMVITQAGQVDVSPTVITVTAEDGSKSRTYQIQFVSEASTNPRLSSIEVNGARISGFSGYVFNYTHQLPYGTTAIPVVTASAQDAATTVTITQATSVNGTATIHCVAQDKTTTADYTINFGVAALSDVTLEDIYLDGESLSGFAPSKYSYTVNLPMSATTAPVVTWKSKYPAGAQTITLLKNTLSEGCKIQVEAPGAKAAKVYKIAYKQEPSANKYLSYITIDYGDGEGPQLLPGWSESKSSYVIMLPQGTTTVPTIAYEEGDSEQVISVTYGGLNGKTTIVVTAGNGTKYTYYITLNVEKSTNANLSMIYLNGEAIEGFRSDSLVYRYTLGDEGVPTVTYDSCDAWQKITMVKTSSRVQIAVTAEAGNVQNYIVRFVQAGMEDPATPAAPSDTIALSDDARLKEILLNGVAVSPFSSTHTEYTIPGYDEEMPTIEAIPADSISRIVTTVRPVDDTTTIEVTALNGNTMTYRLYFPVDRNADAKPDTIEADHIVFDPNVHTYSYVLDYGEDFPEVKVVRKNRHQKVDIETSSDCHSRHTVVRVTSSNGYVTEEYTFLYSYTPDDQTNCLKKVVTSAGEIALNGVVKDTTIDVVLPYGARRFYVESWEKNYGDQSVMVAEGGLLYDTKITVVSGKQGEEDVTYTLRPVRTLYDDAMLRNLRADGAGIVDFQPDQYSYVLAIDDAVPALTWEAAAGAQVSTVSSDIKHTTLHVVNGSYSHDYTVYYYYRNDVIPNADFSQWTTTVYNNGRKPTGWKAPADFGESFTFKVIGIGSTYTTGQEVQSIGDGVRLRSIEDEMSTRSAICGMISLSDQTLNFAAAGNTTSSVLRGGIRFRNSPEQLTLEVNPISGEQEVNGWRFFAIVNGDRDTVLQTGSYSGGGAWQTVALNMPYAQSGILPDSLNVVINSAPTENSKNLDGNSTLDVRNLRTLYSSVLTGVTINGVALSPAGNAFRTEALDMDSLILPELNFAGAVADQQHSFEWSDNWRNGSIRNYAEDGSYTDYQVVVDRPISTNALIDYVQEGNDIHVKALSPYAQLAISRENGVFRVVSTAEDGSEMENEIQLDCDETKFDTTYVAYVVKQDSIVWTDTVVATLNDDAQLAQILIDGADYKKLNFSPSNYDYEIETLDTMILYSTKNSNQHAYMEHIKQGITDYYYIYCYAPAGNHSTYIVRLRHSISSPDATLKDIRVNGESLADFDPLNNYYQLTLPEGSAFPSIIPVVNNDNAMTEQRTSQEKVGDQTLATTTITVTAENGENKGVYTVMVVVPDAPIATLENIYLNGVPLAGFQSDVYEYDVVYTYEELQSYPRVSTERTSYKSVVTDTEEAVGPDTLIHHLEVTNGVAVENYSVRLIRQKSSNTSLKMIYLDGVELAGFSPDGDEYEIQLPNGSEIPTISCDVANDQQHVQVELVDMQATVLVTAGNGNTHEYTLNFNILPSDNSLLESLMIRGEQIESPFNPQKVEYEINYPYGTGEDEIIHKEDILATPADSKATVEIVEEDGLILIYVRAENNESVSVYAIVQNIALNDNAHLRMIYAGGVELRGFDRNEKYYEYLFENSGSESLPNMATFFVGEPEDEKLDSAAVWVTASSSTPAIGDTVYVYCLAQNKVDTMRYAIRLALGADITVMPVSTSCKVVPVPGTHKLKVITLTKDTYCRVFDSDGHLVWASEGAIPPTDPNYVDSYTDGAGNVHIVRVYDESTGMETPELAVGKIYSAVFFTSKGKISLGQKIMFPN